MTDLRVAEDMLYRNRHEIALDGAALSSSYFDDDEDAFFYGIHGEPIHLYNKLTTKGHSRC